MTGFNIQVPSTNICYRGFIGLMLFYDEVEILESINACFIN